MFFFAFIEQALLMEPENSNKVFLNIADRF